MRPPQALLITETALEILNQTGKAQIRLRGNCMFPALQNGDLVTIQKADYKNLKWGDAAVFRTTAETLHANVVFSFRGWKNQPAHFVGKITEVLRGGKTISLEKRSRLRVFFETWACPSNPYFFGAFTFLGRKIKQIVKNSPH